MTLYPLDLFALQKKISHLQRNVNEWKESYDSLVNELRKLALERVVEREEIRIRDTNAKVRCLACVVPASHSSLCSIPCVSPFHSVCIHFLFYSVCPQGLQQAIRRLESELKERLKLLSHAESMNQQLLKEINSLRKERGMREVELNSFSVQLGALSEGKHQAMQLQEDLQNLLKLIQRGIDEGILKVRGRGTLCWP